MEKVVINYLIVSSFFIGLVFFIVSLIWDQKDKVLKIAGGFLVSALTLLADHTGIYALAIFIIATFITKLDFLENLAAIFWGRKEFWEYRSSSLKEATREETENKDQMNTFLTEDIDVTNSYESAPKSRKSTTSIKDFENQVFNALQLSPIAASGQLRRNVKLETEYKGQMRKVIFDGLLENEKVTFILEIKSSINKTVLFKSTEYQVQGMLYYLRKHYEDDNSYKKTRGIVIVPSTVESENQLSFRIAVLKYDVDKKTFTNLDFIKNWMETTA